MTAQAQTTLPRLSTAVASARAFVRSVLDEWECAAALEPAQLVASELAANAVRHSTGEEFDLRLHRDGDLLWIGVADASELPPQLRHPRIEEEGGRGLHIVEALSQDWGHHRDGDGKVVWSELAC